MSNVSIAWDQTAPADGDGAGFGASQIRSLKTAISTALAAEHVFPTSTGNAGAHLAGSARVFVGSGSQVSSADTAGRLMWDQTHEALYYLSSTSTAYIGSRNALSVTNSGMTNGIGQRLQASFYSLSGTSWPSGQIAFSPSFVGNPYVVVSIVTSALPAGLDGKTNSFARVYELTNGSVRVAIYNSDTGSNVTAYNTVHVMAFGAVAI